MNEDSSSSYEPLAEISIKYENDVDFIYCLCSRVIVQTPLKRKKLISEEIQQTNDSHDLTVTEFCQNLDDKNYLKKREETVSCYCSASHYSTDEHDSLSQPAHESDSGADVSVTSRDLEWERYWAQNGDRIVWESWITKYNNYMDPIYSNNYGSQDLLAEKDDRKDEQECSMTVSENNCAEKDSKQTVRFKQTADEFLIESEDVHNFSKHEETKLSEQAVLEPPILSVGDYDREEDMNSSESRKCTDISKTEDFFDDQFRLRTGSRSSGNSGHFTATTDSMTNVTRITLSTSSSSSEDLSKTESSISPTSSSTSYTEQWQQLWNEHFNDLYNTHYNDFILHYKESDPLLSWEPVTEIINNVLGEPDYDDQPNGIFIDSAGSFGNQVPNEALCKRVTQIQISIAQKTSEVETPDKKSSLNATDTKVVKSPSDINGESQSINFTGSKNSEVNKTIEIRKREHMIANSISATIQRLIVTKASAATDKVRLPTDVPKEIESVSDNLLSNNYSSTIISVPLINDNSLSNVNIESVSSSLNGISNSQINHGQNCVISPSNSKADKNPKNSEECIANLSDSHPVDSASFTSSKLQNPILKEKAQKHQFNLRRMKQAFTLMGFEFQPVNQLMPEKVHIDYLKANIKRQNNSLQMHSRKHTYFDDEGNVVSEQVKNFSKNEAGEKSVSCDLNQKVEASQIEVKTSNPVKLPVEKSTSEESNENIWSECTTNNEVDHSPSNPSKTTQRSNVPLLVTSKETVCPDGSEVSPEKCSSSSSSSEYDENEDRLRFITRKSKKLNSAKKRADEKKKKLPPEILESPNLYKYWMKRYSLFSKFDEGIKLDKESWYSVTPECMSKHISERCQCDLIIDAFCGAGGNTIQFARTCERVIAIDIDPVKVELARNNAKVYGVEDRIEFIVGDFLKLAPTLRADVVFLSPPWGGPKYLKESVFDLEKILSPVGGRKLLEIAKEISQNVCYYLPRNSNVDQLIPLSGEKYELEVEQNFMKKKLIAVSVYFGELIHVEDSL